ncbi:PREDICTED: complement factor H-related protein 1-like [Branchiostoma belcheri]|uniref:Complement factor H-related protein 1-like n=1 Tax=Branchiostoma belcheri TaxID=7741 RepID=A0A6P4YD13_BRABE|nr:PREDICTED: complement factor H-related protein 1-like [Branchiostoma belcheri]
MTACLTFPFQLTRSSLSCLNGPPGRRINNHWTDCNGQGPYPHGAKCEYTCRLGYGIVSGSRTRFCRNGAWTGSPLVCGGGTTCRSPPTVLNTIRRGCYPRYEQGEVCRYSCRPGYSRVFGSTSKVCRYGSWVGTDLVCRYTATLSCSSAPPLRTWSYMYGCYVPYTHGKTCHFGCRSGYPQTGSRSRTCRNGVWTGTPLTCVAPYW